MLSLEFLTLHARQSIRTRLQAVLGRSHKSSAEYEHTNRTIFEEYMSNRLPPSDKAEDVLFENAQMLVGAGFETTGSTLSTAHYHALANPQVCRRLKTELANIWSDPQAIPAWNALESLPYLNAVIQESLRLSVGVMSRLPRVNHQSSMRYGDWIIPPGTPISMSQRFIHFDPSIYPDPWRFDPERWMQGEKSKQLEKYLVSFSRGSRGCLGMQ